MIMVEEVRRKYFPLQTAVWSSQQQSVQWGTAIMQTRRSEHLLTRTELLSMSKGHFVRRTNGQPAIAKICAKRSAWQIPILIVLFVILVVKIQFVSPHLHYHTRIIHLLTTEQCYWALFSMSPQQLYNICLLYLNYRLQINWVYKKN
jgi:hypothetical protein